jgi:capsular polysaccharide biosynthesis protein
LLAKKLAAQMAENLEQRQEGERLDVLDPASLPTKPERPDRFTAGIGGVVVSLLLALATPFMLFFTDTSFKDPDELRSEHGLPVAATIPLVGLIESRASSRALRLRALAISSVCMLAGTGVIWFAALKGIL